MADTLDASGGQLKPPQPQKPILPVAGFWARGLAFVADVMLLAAVFYMLIFAAKEALFALGGWSMPLSVLVIVAYFMLGDGPVGKGRTVGKFLAGIRVTDYAGQPLSSQAAIIRALVKSQVIIVQIPIILAMQSLEQTTQIEYWKILAVLIVYSATLLATLFFALHIGLSPLKQAPYDKLARTMVFKQDSIGSRQAVVDAYDTPQIYNKLRRAAIMWSSVISIGFFCILCWPLVRDQQRNNEFFQKERVPFLERFEVAGLGVPQWPLLSPNPVEFVILEDESEDSGDAPAALPPPADAATTSPLAAQPPRDIKIRMNYLAQDGGKDVPPEVRARLEAQFPELRDWFYPWFYKNFGENTKQANVVGFQIAVVRVIPIIVRPHREDILVLEDAPDPELGARAEAQYVNQPEE